MVTLTLIFVVRFWKKVFVRLVYQGDNPVLQLFNTKEDKDPFQELPLQACYSVSDIGNCGDHRFVAIKLVTLFTILVYCTGEEGTLSENNAGALNDIKMLSISFKCCLNRMLHLTEIYSVRKHAISQ